MSILGRIADSVSLLTGSSRMKRKHNKMVRAFFDAAKRSANNQRRWAQADQQGVKNPYNDNGERKILMNRARYVAANNPYAKGMVLSMANDVIGTGPKLQIINEDQTRATRIEKAWRIWSKKVKLARKLRAMRAGETVDGEAFGVISKNPKIDFPIQLDLLLINPALVQSPDFTYDGNDLNTVDGIKYDEWGNPTSYSILTNSLGISPSNYKNINANDMVHVYRLDTCGQKRGVSELTPSLEIFNILRLYILSVLDASQTAAALSGVAYTSGTPEEYDEMSQFFEWELERNQIMFLPEGWDFKQLIAEHPSANFSEFVNTIVNLAARAILLPYNVAAGNSSEYNFASGRLDFQAYHTMIKIVRREYEELILDRLFSEWYNVYLAREARQYNLDSIIEYQWFWDGFAEIDPLKSARAESEKLENGTTTLAQLCAENGEDYQEVIAQRVKERALKYELETKAGLPHETSKTTEQKESEETEEKQEENETAKQEA